MSSGLAPAHRAAGWVGRIPIRARLAVAFALVTAAALAGIGALVYARTSSALTDRIDRDLERALIDEVGGRPPGRFGPPRRQAPGAPEVQVIGPSGQVFGGGGPLGGVPVLGGEDLSRARVATTPLVSEGVVGGARVRRLAVPGPEGVVAVAVASTADRDAALSGLRRELIIGGLMALAFAALGGYLLAALALRPVEAMRRRAAAVTARTPGARLPVPPADDEIHRLGDTLNEMLARLEEAMARERAFVADAAHELRTPLAILRGEIEIATSRPRPPEELRQALESAGEEADRLSQLAEDLLVIARADQGRLPIRPEAVRLPDLLERVARRFAPRAARTGRRIVVECPPGREAHADPLRLEQALGNLVENALRHGAGEVRLTAGAAPDGGIELAVVDAGPGFAAGFLPRAFDRFTRGDLARAEGGAGLGLAIVAAIADAHGGRAGAGNPPEGGAAVWIRLPAAPAVLSALG